MSNNNDYSPLFVDNYLQLQEEAIAVFEEKELHIPDAAYDFMVGPDGPKFIEKMLAQYKLVPGQGKEIARIIRDVVMAYVYIGDIVPTIQTKLGVSEETARGIASAMVTELFAPVMEDIKKYQMEVFQAKILQNQAEKETQKTARTAGVPADNVVNLRKDKP